MRWPGPTWPWPPVTATTNSPPLVAVVPPLLGKINPATGQQLSVIIIDPNPGDTISSAAWVLKDSTNATVLSGSLSTTTPAVSTTIATAVADVTQLSGDATDVVALVDASGASPTGGTIAVAHSGALVVIQYGGVTGNNLTSCNTVAGTGALSVGDTVSSANYQTATFDASTLRDTGADFVAADLAHVPPEPLGEDSPWTITKTGGKSRTLRQGTDATFLAYGSTAWQALDAAKLLENEGLSVGVIDARFCKPLDGEMLKTLFAKNGGGHPILTVEDHSIINGFGSAVIEHAQEKRYDARLVTRLGLPDRFIKHASRPEQFKEVGLDPAGLARSARAAIEEARAIPTEAAPTNRTLPQMR